MKGTGGAGLIGCNKDRQESLERCGIPITNHHDLFVHLHIYSALQPRHVRSDFTIRTLLDLFYYSSGTSM